MKFKKYLHIEGNRIYLDNLKSAFKIVSRKTTSIHPLEDMNKSLYYEDNNLYLDTGNYNGFRLGYFPDNMVRLELGHDCLEVQEKGFLKTECKEFEVESGQYFRWIQIHINRDYLNMLTRNNNFNREEDFIKNSHVDSNPPTKDKSKIEEPEEIFIQESKPETNKDYRTVTPIQNDGAYHTKNHSSEKVKELEPKKSQRIPYKDSNNTSRKLKTKHNPNDVVQKENQYLPLNFTNRRQQYPREKIKNSSLDEKEPTMNKLKQSSVLPSSGNKIIKLEPQINLVIPKDIETSSDPPNLVEENEMEENEPLESEYIPEEEEIPRLYFPGNRKKQESDSDFFPELVSENNNPHELPLPSTTSSVKKEYVTIKEVTVTDTVTKILTKTVVLKPKKKDSKLSKNESIPSSVALQPSNKKKYCKGLCKGLTDLFNTENNYEIDDLEELDKCDDVIKNINKRIFKIEYFNNILS